MIEESLSKLENTIEHWTNVLTQNDSSYYDYAFFKIFVKLELYIIDMFKKYSLGIASSSGFIPERKLHFINSDHLDNIFKNRRASFIEYFEVIEKKSKYIFIDDKDPFSLIYSDADLSNFMDKFRIIRNYIAHESDESRKKYISNILNNGAYISVNEFFIKKNRGRDKSNFTVYVEKIVSIKEIIHNPTPYI